jgi:hypothetical protein
MTFGLLEGRGSWIRLASELQGMFCTTRLVPQERRILRIEFSLPSRRGVSALRAMALATTADAFGTNLRTRHGAVREGFA